MVLIGNRKWIREKNFIEIPADVENKLQAQEQLGHTAILVAVDGKEGFHNFAMEPFIYRVTIHCRVSAVRLTGQIFGTGYKPPEPVNDRS